MAAGTRIGRVCGLGLSLTLFCAPAFGQAGSFRDPNGNLWVLTNSVPEQYFIPNGSMTTNSSVALTNSVLQSAVPELRNQATTQVEQAGTTTTNTIKRDRPSAKTTVKRPSGRYVISYALWDIDHLATTTDTTPYKIMSVTTWQERTNSTYLQTFTETIKYSWIDPITGQPLSTSRAQQQEPVSTLTQSAWQDKTRSVQTSQGTHTKSVDAVLSSTPMSQVIGQVTSAALSSYGQGAGSGGAVGFSGDSGRGRSGSTSSVARTASLSGSSKVKAAGGRAGVDLNEILAAAAGQPDLYDGAGHKAWKLTAVAGSLVFSAYRPDGGLASDPITLPAGSYQGRSSAGSVAITSSQVHGPTLELRGTFEEPLLGETSQTLRTKK